MSLSKKEGEKSMHRFVHEVHRVKKTVQIRKFDEGMANLTLNIVSAGLPLV